MSELFSLRQGLISSDICSKMTRGQLWTIFAKKHVYNYTQNVVKYDVVEDMLLALELPCDMQANAFDHANNIKRLQQYIVNEAPWYKVFDFIELYLQSQRPKDFSSTMTDIINSQLSLNSNLSSYDETVYAFNQILYDNHTGYRIVNGFIVPCGVVARIDDIDIILNKADSHVKKAVKKAISLFAERPKVDNNNAVKEIISATEAVCCTIAAEWGATNTKTLGDALNYITKNEDKHPIIVLHPALKAAIGNLYGYASDEDGIRHQGTTFTEVEIAEASLVLTTCASIINVLIEKYNKVQQSLEVGEKEVPDEVSKSE